jgi:outer membrane protein TolC
MRRTLFLIPLLLIPAATAAQEETVLTEEEFLSVLDEQHPAVLALSRDLGTAEAKRKQAALLRDPRLEIMREQPDNVPRETVWGIAWVPPLDGRRRWAVREAEAAVEAERSSLDSELARLRLEMRRTFAEWAGSNTRVATLGELSQGLEALAQRMRHRADSGEESLLNARRLEIAFESSKIALSEAVANAAAARAVAGVWLGPVETYSPSDLSAVQPRLPELPKPPEVVDSVLRPDLVAASFRVEQADALERLSKRVIAAPEVLLGWKTIEGSSIDFNGPVFALNWTVPVFDRRQADRLAARNVLTAARARSEWLLQEAKSEVAAAEAAYIGLRRNALSGREALDDLGDVVRAATAAYEQGESSVTDLLDTLRAVVDARLSALELYLAALEAHRDLEFATGRSLTSGGLS